MCIYTYIYIYIYIYTYIYTYIFIPIYISIYIYIYKYIRIYVYIHIFSYVYIYIILYTYIYIYILYLVFTVENFRVGTPLPAREEIVGAPHVPPGRRQHANAVPAFIWNGNYVKHLVAMEFTTHITSKEHAG